MLDQFSRHVYRNAVRPAENDAEALALANLMLQRQWHLELPVPLAVFSLMPLRHTPTIPRLERVVREIESRGARLQSAQNLLEKFRRATASRLDMLRSGGAMANGSDDTLRVEAKEGSGGLGDDAFEDVLEHVGFLADPNIIGRHGLVKTICGFIQKLFLHQELCQQPFDLALVVSLSGGVDSMVIARILVHLRDTLLSSQSQNGGQRVPPGTRVGRRKGDKRAGALVPLGMFASLTVVAIHINYGNRAESGREASFLRQWCSSFGIDFHERRIDEVSRGKTPRDIYERRSREIRFAFYREVLAKYTVTPMRCPGIFFGHHQGDVQENVISNFFSRRATPLDLSGMAPTSVIDRITVATSPPPKG